MGKIILMWAVITGVIYGIKYVMSKDEKLSLRDIVVKVIDAGFYGIVAVLILYQLNNISGV